MRNWIIGAAAVLALAVPGVAAAQTGYVGLGYSQSDFGGGADEVDTYGVEGAVAFAGSGSIVFELDATIGTTDGAGDNDTGYGLVGHVYSRNDRHLIGAFVGVSGADDSETFVVGAEGNLYFDNITLAGAVFYGDNEDADADGVGANVEGRLFIHDNFRLNANLGIVSVDTGADDDEVTLAGIGGEYQFSGAPVSIALGYQTADFDGGDVDTWSVALRYNWGGTLRDRDRNGASQASVLGLSSGFAG